MLVDESAPLSAMYNFFGISLQNSKYHGLLIRYRNLNILRIKFNQVQVPSFKKAPVLTNDRPISAKDSLPLACKLWSLFRYLFACVNCFSFSPNSSKVVKIWTAASTKLNFGSTLLLLGPSSWSRIDSELLLKIYSIYSRHFENKPNLRWITANNICNIYLKSLLRSHHWCRQLAGNNGTGWQFT